MLRSIIKIDQELCDGCGNCVPGCPEGALQIIDGKARLVGDLFCDGLGACLGECPVGAITVEEREAEPYDEKRVMENIVKQGPGTIRAHLSHLKDHNETGYLREALEFLKAGGHPVPDGFGAGPNPIPMAQAHTGCPGSMAREISRKPDATASVTSAPAGSELTQWPIQLHLVNPLAPYFREADLLVAADCVPFALADFHSRFLRGKKLIILCPKLDQGIDVYIEKLTALFSEQNIRSVSILHMEVPCCFGVGKVVQEALSRSGMAIPLSDYTITMGGEVKEEQSRRAVHAV
jgi:ferredoxin